MGLTIPLATIMALIASTLQRKLIEISTFMKVIDYYIIVVH